MSSCAVEEQAKVEPGIVNSSPSSPTQKGLGIFSRLLSFSPLGPKTENPVQKSPVVEESAQVYYGVYIPCESKVGADEDSSELRALHVYTEREEAFKIAKKYKKARFKALRNRQEAVVFALRGAEPLLERNQSIGDGLLVNDSSSTEGLQPAHAQFASGEKPSQFKGPKLQEMIVFRKVIESGDVETVRRMVWENPRYLVSSGDTPSILQEGSRYNALHVAVKTTNAPMCDFLLSTISDPHFVQLLYGDENIESSKTRAVVMLDLYLNMPDKAMNETPLHFAVKFGAKEIVDLLVSYPQCSLTVMNKYGDQPKDIICQRVGSSDASLVSEISCMLRERFYVPVLHSEDSTRQPVIGEPFSPASPPTLNSDPISPRLEIRAFAGPMDRDEAVIFRRKWKTPPRSSGLRTTGETLAAARFRLHDVHKGLEKVGRDLAQKMKVGWREYWPFLDTFTDLTSTEGLDLLEDHLKMKYVSQWNMSSNSVIAPDSFQISPKTPVEEKTLQVLTQKLSFSPTKGGNNNDGGNALSPITDLCMALKSCNLNENINKYKSNCVRMRTLSDSKNSHQAIDDETATNLFLNPGLSPYLYVEKSCLVFAKRMALGLAHSLATESEMVLECLKSETKHLQQTVASYMDDPRFHTVDFHLIHSRVAQLVAQKLRSEHKYNDDLDLLKASLKDIAHPSGRNSDLFSSDEDETFITYRSSPKESKNFGDKKNRASAQVSCVASSILKWISDKKTEYPVKTYKTEEECIDIWSDLFKCHCTWQTEQFFRNYRKNASLKRSQIKSRDGSELSTSPKTGIDIVSRRLTFDNDYERGERVRSGSYPKSDRNHNLPNANNCVLSTSPNNKRNSIGNIIHEHENSVEDVARMKDENPDLFSSDDDYNSDSEEVFATPQSSVTPEFMSSEDSEYEEADDGTKTLQDNVLIDVFIHGDKPHKMDKTVYDALFDCPVDREKYPYIYKWKHKIGLYSQEEINSWPMAHFDDFAEEPDSPISCSFNIGHISKFGTSTPTSKKITNIYTLSRDQEDGFISPSVKCINGTIVNPLVMLTPKSNNLCKEQSYKSSATPPMQVSKWMRVTGPNSPRSAFVNKNFRPNVSFGF